MTGTLAVRWLLTAVFATAGGQSRSCRSGPPCRVINIVGVEGGQAGLMAGAFVALHEKMGQPPDLATSWR